MSSVLELILFNNVIQLDGHCTASRPTTPADSPAAAATAATAAASAAAVAWKSISYQHGRLATIESWLLLQLRLRQRQQRILIELIEQSSRSLFLCGVEDDERR